jgi:hypothetical protein
MELLTQHCARASAIASLLCACAAAACAGTASDPTRPSPAWMASQPGSPEKEKPRMQPMETQVIVYSADRKIAVVDGVLVRLGETYNGERLVSMKRNQVEWKHVENDKSITARPAIVKTVLRSGENK